jgi:hypothetical protein
VDTNAFRLNERVRLSDRREGLVNSIFSGGAPPGDKRPPDIITVLADDYVQVECWPWQVAKTKRVKGYTVDRVLVKSKDPEGSFYQVELDNIARLRMAIWHDHWDRCGLVVAPEYGLIGQYLDEYRNGNKVPLPECEDIRTQVPSPPVVIERPRMF